MKKNKKIKILIVVTILAMTLVACKGKGTTEIKATVEKEVETEVVETNPTETNVNSTVKMTNDDIDDLLDLLEDTGDVDDDKVNDELELVDLAEDWISELAEMNINIDEIKQYTKDWLIREEEKEVLRFKEVFPKLNDYALGLINGDAATLELYSRTDDDGDEKLDDEIVTQEQWTEVYNGIMSLI